MNLSLEIESLKQGYAEGALTPSDTIREVYRKIRNCSQPHAFIHVEPVEEALDRAKRLEQEGYTPNLPLYGIPFAVKDNIDVRGLPTTAGCPEYRYIAVQTAFVVNRLLSAGAVLIGKTNMDQFSMGLSGTRTPYGSCSSVFDDRYISGGSSSGSAVAVAAGIVSFALGTDSAGSYAVPAGCNNIIGLKPSRGVISASGLLPACRSLECVSIFAGNMEDAKTVYRISAEYDPNDPFSRVVKKRFFPFRSFRFGVPSRKDLEFFGDDEASGLFEEAIRRMESIGGIKTAINYSPFREVSNLLYQGPYLAERLQPIRNFFESKKEAIHPVIRGIIGRAASISAVEAFEGYYQLKGLRKKAEREWDRMDLLLLPTTGTIYTIEGMIADPVRLNANLGYYTNFVNLFDLSSVALRSGFRSNGLPFGITLTAPLHQDENLFELGEMYLARLDGGKVRDNRHHMPKNTVRIAVTGEYMSGQPLNGELLERGGVFSRRVQTDKGYGLYALSGVHLHRPCMAQTADGSHTIEVEVWEMPVDRFGVLTALLPPPFVIGTVLLEDGEEVKGILCDGVAVREARDISEYGGWKQYIESLPVSAEK